MVDQKWLEACIQAGEFLYGIFPAALLKKCMRENEVTKSQMKS